MSPSISASAEDSRRKEEEEEGEEERGWRDGGMEGVTLKQDIWPVTETQITE